MTDALKGKTVPQARQLIDRFRTAMISREQGEQLAELGKLAVLEGVRQYPMRVKCATLAWHTLHAALDRSNETVTTE